VSNSPFSCSARAQIVLEGIRGTHGGEQPREQATSKGCRDLDITVCWRVEVDLGGVHDTFNLARALRLQGYSTSAEASTTATLRTLPRQPAFS
jgi:hypothetical protein